MSLLTSMLPPIGTKGGAGATNLSIGTKTATTLDINSDTGTNASIPLATPTTGTNEAGLMSPAQVDAIVANTAKVTNATHTGDVTGATVLTIANNAVTNAKAAQMAANTIKGNNTGGAANAADLTKTQTLTLLNVADGATANSTDATLLNRANHTGTQAASTISTGTFADALIAASNVTQHVGAIDHNATLNYAVAQHRIINDAGTSATELWSANKISNTIASISAGQVRKGNIDTSTEGLGNITLSGEQTLNGLLTNVSRVLVMAQTNAADNGIYVSAAGAWARATDMDQDAEIQVGVITTVDNAGSTKTGVNYVSIDIPPTATIGVTPLNFQAQSPLSFGTVAGTATEGDDSRVPTQDENNALVGTSGVPSTANKYVTDADPRIPTTGENDALVGTNGTPSTSNKYVTNTDPRNTDSRTCNNTFDSAATAKTNLALVKGDVGLGNVDNTADSAKPVSTAQQTALNGKTDRVSGTPTNQIPKLDASGNLVGATGIRSDASGKVEIGTTYTPIFGNQYPIQTDVPMGSGVTLSGLDLTTSQVVGAGEKTLHISLDNRAATSGSHVLIQAIGGTSTVRDGNFEIFFSGGVGRGFTAHKSGCLGIKATSTAPITDAALSFLYVDSADGDLKVKFSNGTVKTIATNP